MASEAFFMYEIVIIQRDGLNRPIEDQYGNPKRRLFRTDSSDELADLWSRNGPQTRKKKKNVQNRKDAPKE